MSIIGELNSLWPLSKVLLKFKNQYKINIKVRRPKNTLEMLFSGHLLSNALLQFKSQHKIKVKLRRPKKHLQNVGLNVLSTT